MQVNGIAIPKKKKVIERTMYSKHGCFIITKLPHEMNYADYFTPGLRGGKVLIIDIIEPRNT